eukprot:CAMPEP_0206429236 /NCGR_PEP_ID=MMETSP0324_2-20121206/6119_1 /ASSEMBLY_ACC=CAM_ASM_000836 /TAXON_ID=2866 /ORGANISM="Crypthecodinium cohnii, Strain Seligo" /LENGTH=363 /DNA_ID=CAMNT_0053894875 /DNA_START=124 /DNA_END=1216 /DNA_ORIENTATION=-
MGPKCARVCSCSLFGIAACCISLFVYSVVTLAYYTPLYRPIECVHHYISPWTAVWPSSGANSTIATGDGGDNVTQANDSDSDPSTRSNGTAVELGEMHLVGSFERRCTNPNVYGIKTDEAALDILTFKNGALSVIGSGEIEPMMLSANHGVSSSRGTIHVTLPARSNTNISIPIITSLMVKMRSDIRFLGFQGATYDSLEESCLVTVDLAEKEAGPLVCSQSREELLGELVGVALDRDEVLRLRPLHHSLQENKKTFVLIIFMAFFGASAAVSSLLAKGMSCFGEEFPCRKTVCSAAVVDEFEGNGPGSKDKEMVGVGLPKAIPPPERRRLRLALSDESERVPTRFEVGSLAVLLVVDLAWSL